MIIWSFYQFLIFYSENKHDWNTASEYKLTGSHNPPTSSSHLTNLKPYKEYLAQVLAENEIGLSKPSADSNVVRTHEASEYIWKQEFR
jgi:hypothetical protein